jgi:uncharacterized membrane protein
MSSFPSNFARVAPVVSAVFGIAYPFVIYSSLDRVGTQAILILAGVLVMLRLLISGLSIAKPFFVGGVCAVAATGLFAVVSPDVAPLLYPVFMNAAAALAFGMSLFSSRSIIEVIAGVYEETLSAQAKAYMRKVTAVWCAFLSVNTVVSLGTVLLEDRQIWMLYNGFLSYLLMGVLFAVEYLVRRTLQSRGRT